MKIKLTYPQFWHNRNWISCLLIPFSWIYLFLGVIRKFFSRTEKLPGKVICVGNMSVGGTGKTQVVIWLAQLLKKQGVSFVILSKGYGSKLKYATQVSCDADPMEVGDESILLSKYGLVIASPKIKDSISLLKSIKADVIIVDDGMQNPSFFKDFNILTIDPLRACGNNLIFPAGPLREHTALAIKRADLIVMIGNINCPDRALLTAIKRSDRPHYSGRIKLISNIDKNKKYIAFTGIGNPSKFFFLLQEYKIKILEEISYPDHYNYPKEELDKLREKAQKHGCALITTGKDYVKIPYDPNIHSVDIELNFKKESEIIALLNEKILQKN